MTLYMLARDTHIAFGSAGLVIFWTTAALRKGTRLHRRMGNAYLLAMLGVIVTAAPLAANAFARGLWALGLFLAYLIVITATAAWLARRAIRERTSIAAYAGAPYAALAWINIVAGIVMLTAGLSIGAPLLLGMSVIGVFVGARMLSFARHPPSNRNWWLKRHYTAIIGAGAATHIAFLNLGFARLVPAQYASPVHYFAWFGPLAIAVAASWWLNRRYGRGSGNPGRDKGESGRGSGDQGRGSGNPAAA